MKLLNLGCGSRFHLDWVNLDIKSSNPIIQAHDLRKTIPFPNQTFDVVYHSHLLEHIPKPEALVFMRECFRVLKSEGVIRVVVPDLEMIVRMYLQSLEKAIEDNTESNNIYYWMMLELYDQTVREYSGGAMLGYLKQNPIPDQDFVIERVGKNACNIRHPLRFESTNNQEKRNSIFNIFHSIHHLSVLAQGKVIKMILGEENYKAFLVGRFRLGGEIHHWMYDRYSLAQLLIQSGFCNPVQRAATDSAIPNWVDLNLDTEPDGSIYKPDSLFMEATKPSL